MPHVLKQKLRRYDRLNSQAKELHGEISAILDEYEVPYEHLTAMNDHWSTEPSTEALAFINNSEGDIENNIKDIEEVFLYFVNKSNV